MGIYDFFGRVAIKAPNIADFTLGGIRVERGNGYGAVVYMGKSRHVPAGWLERIHRINHGKHPSGHPRKIHIKLVAKKHALYLIMTGEDVTHLARDLIELNSCRAPIIPWLVMFTAQRLTQLPLDKVSGARAMTHELIIRHAIYIRTGRFPKERILFPHR